MPANCTNSATFQAELDDGSWLEGGALEALFKRLGFGGKQYTLSKDTLTYEVKSTGTIAGRMSTTTAVSTCRRHPKKVPAVKDALKHVKT